MLWTLIGILLVLWILGLVFKVAGGLIHILLVIAAIVFIVKFIAGRGRGRM
ncbi:lmo0937 family membrane protein [Peribacillus sp. SCS-26]|uniref:lmo0937 family membrane protein n=1 Tax=Paraperibacillus marinus TaxID=3115295 RepID=UPI0039059ABC